MLQTIKCIRVSIENWNPEKTFVPWILFCVLKNPEQLGGCRRSSHWQWWKAFQCPSSSLCMHFSHLNMPVSCSREVDTFEGPHKQIMVLLDILCFLQVVPNMKLEDSLFPHCTLSAEPLDVLCIRPLILQFGALYVCNCNDFVTHTNLLLRCSSISLSWKLGIPQWKFASLENLFGLINSRARSSPF